MPLNRGAHTFHSPSDSPQRAEKPAASSSTSKRGQQLNEQLHAPTVSRFARAIVVAKCKPARRLLERCTTQCRDRKKFAGMTLAEFEAKIKPSQDARAELAALND